MVRLVYLIKLSNQKNY